MSGERGYISDMKLRKAEIEELDLAMQLIDGAKEHLKEQGIAQWQNGYPDLEQIRKDIESRTGYFLIEADNIIGYFCLNLEGDPDYQNLKGKWRSNRNYGVVHRLAINARYRGKGNADAAFALIEEVCRKNAVFSIRIDTHGDNRKMQHILRKNGFAYCGTVWIDGSDKAAFEKLLSM